MQVYPALNIMNGHCVTLTRGRLSEPEIWHVDPVARARDYAAAGAHWLHVTDLDAVAGTGENNALLEDIILHAGVPVQLGGGFRSLEMIENWIAKGAGRIVLGTIAVLQPDIVRQAAHRHPDQIVLSVDIYRGRVMSHGWTEPSAFAPADFIRNFATDPLAGIIVTDIDADLGEAEAPLAQVTALARKCRTPVIASGLVGNLDDLSRLKYVRNIAGAVIGRALIDKRIDLAAAIRLAEAPVERQPDFV